MSFIEFQRFSLNFIVFFALLLLSLIFLWIQMVQQVIWDHFFNLFYSFLFDFKLYDFSYLNLEKPLVNDNFNFGAQSHKEQPTNANPPNHKNHKNKPHQPLNHNPINPKPNPLNPKPQAINHRP